jgi:hypothetical protein
MTPRLLCAYRAPRYEASGVAVFVGRRSSAMDVLLWECGVRVGVFVTAWNPMSRRMPPGWNARMQVALAERLRRFAILPAEGSWRDWREAHLLVLAAPVRVAILARLFRQQAVLAARSARAARLEVVGSGAAAGVR